MKEIGSPADRFFTWLGNLVNSCINKILNYETRLAHLGEQAQCARSHQFTQMNHN